MIHEAMYITQKALEAHPMLLTTFGLQETDVLDRYLIRSYPDEMIIGTNVSFSIYSREEFRSVYRWVAHEIGEIWREVLPITSKITTLKLTHMGDAHTELLIHVPETCPADVRVIGVSLVHMRDVLKSMDDRSGLQIEYSWKWELVTGDD